LEKVKVSGRRIVYDIDDNLFAIPRDNPASRVIGRDQQMAAAACMKLADVVTVTTDRLAEAVRMTVGVVPVVVPNALDVSDGWEWDGGDSPDGVDRVFWQGSSTHSADWELCVGAVESVMEEREGVRLVILGHLPPSIEAEVSSPPWRGRVEYLGFSAPETYYRLIHHVKAQVGLAPLLGGHFNACKCVAGGTRIVTDGGVMRIRDVPDDVGDDMRVWRDGKFRKIVASVKYEDVPTIRITTKRGYQIEGTPHHRMMRVGAFARLEDFKVGDMMELSFFEFPDVPYQRLSCPLFWTKKLDDLDLDAVDERMAPTVEVNERWGRFLGCLLGDGHLGGANDIRISCDRQDEDVVRDVEVFARGVGLKPKRKDKKRSDGYSGRGVDVSIPSRSLRWFLAEKCGFMGKYGKKLVVPDVVWRSPKEVVREFLRGLFEADGTVCRGNCSFTTKEFELAQDVMFLLLGFGILARLRTCYNKRYDREYYIVVLQRQACDVFEREVGFCSERKREKLSRITARPHSNAFKAWGMFDEVVKIEVGRADVYDLQVPDGESYMANGFVSHNSPIKYLEYSLMGMPTVASDVPPYGDVIEDGVDGRLVSSSEEWAEAILWCLTKKNRRMDMVKAARRKVGRTMDLGSVARRWKEVLCDADGSQVQDDEA
jgi:intein/homing endonuclease